MKKITQCWLCLSDDLEWLSAFVCKSDVQDGRLKLSDVSTVYYLACHCCGETLQSLNESQGLTLLNMGYFE